LGKLIRFLIIFSFGLTLKASIIKVPSEFASIEDALIHSQNGDTILVAPGTYQIQNKITINKKIFLTSSFLSSSNMTSINNTIVKPAKKDMHEWFELAAEGCKVSGFKFIGNSKHTLNITASNASVTHCKFIGGKDQLSMSGGGGYVGYCYFEGAGDDAIDCDNSIDWVIEHNTIVNAHQDGIEIRLHKKKEPLTKHYFRFNRVIGSGESGIQLIDYKGNSFREFYINNNIFQNCLGSGVSCMYKEMDNTVEVYRGSLMEEKAYVYNNTFAECNYGLTISPGLLILNNIFTGIKTKAIERGIYVNNDNDRSITDYCNFFDNKLDLTKDVIIGTNNLINIDPHLDNNYLLKADSPCIDAGVANYAYEGKKLIIPQKSYFGKAPDIGAYEYGSSIDNAFIPAVSAGKDILLKYPKNSVTLKAGLNNDAYRKTMHIRWKKLSGPGNVQFSDPDKLNTTVKFSSQGIYVLKITAENSLYNVSDEITVYYVKDFKDKRIIAGKSKNVLVEGEDYRYLVGSAEVVTDSRKKIKTITSQSALGCAIYQISTADSGTYYLWLLLKNNNPEKGSLSVSFNDIHEAKIILGNQDKYDSKFTWQKFKFSGIPEGIYFLKIIPKSPAISWDKLFITCNAQKQPF